MNKTARKLGIALLAVGLAIPAWSGSISSVRAEASGSPSVSLLYFNDGHEISPVTDKLGTRGGVARVKTLVDSVPGEKIVAFGGDLGGGTLFGGVFKGHPMVEALGRIPVDVANFGQHDFDAGVPNTLELINNSRFRWISSNLTGSDGKPFGQVPEYVVTEKQGIRIGILGLTSAMETTMRDERVKSLNVIESAQKAVNKLKQAKVDMIVALTQEPVADDKALLAAVPDIRAVFTEEEAEEKSFVHEVDGGSRFIFSPQGNMGAIIRLVVNKETDGTIRLSHEILKVDETVQEDKRLAEMAADYQAKLDAELGKKVASLAGDLPYGDNHESRFRETAIGNWIADAYRDYYGTDIAFANGGGIRASAKKGDFTLKDAKSILPFGNKIVKVEATGEMVLKALENGVSGVEKLAGGFLQVSGIAYEYDADKPSGQRVRNARIGGQPIDKDAVYTLALSNYMFTGGDNYTMFAKAKPLVGAGEALTDFELLAAYASKQKQVHVQPEGRIAVKGFADVPSGHWAHAAVKGLTDVGVVSGAGEGRFAPNAGLSRKEAGEMVSKALAGKVNASVWNELGLDGEDMTTPVVRQELALLAKWLYEKKTGKTLPAAAKSPFADDAAMPDGMKAAVSGLAQLGLVEGRQSNQFAPQEQATRAEVAHLVWNILSK
ncbi:5'-nucleotidase C-terminal domain-containing protein [Paenibacillus tyrfis]|uniref:5'-nucleotidase C-terminal domain-containing protein n=1 Tax=Paenibacillus tyrfis TaxID=1501230 RepID=UPI00209CF02B|nr:5'-nucleotidase C-terminal domain-containing protein [Paenibacillus tyrfis]MCP1308076.1 5'-nucleotidase C-terminal domain-containing protein [Paenibacillus tyrfis]